MRFPSPPYSNCRGGTCLTIIGTEGRFQIYRVKSRAWKMLMTGRKKSMMT